jgi:hypothetical protein
MKVQSLSHGRITWKPFLGYGTTSKYTFMVRFHVRFGSAFLKRIISRSVTLEFSVILEVEISLWTAKRKSKTHCKTGRVKEPSAKQNAK